MSPPNPASPDPGTDRATWTQFYNDLRAERDQLRKDLLKMREDYHDLYFGVMYGNYKCPYTMHEIVEFAAHRQSIQEIIDELSREYT